MNWNFFLSSLSTALFSKWCRGVVGGAPRDREVSRPNQLGVPVQASSLQRVPRHPKLDLAGQCEQEALHRVFEIAANAGGRRAVSEIYKKRSRLNLPNYLIESIQRRDSVSKVARKGLPVEGAQAASVPTIDRLTVEDEGATRGLCNQ